MGSIDGTYACDELSAKFEVTTSDDSNGEGKGTFSLAGMKLDVRLHYHFKNSVGPETTLEFSGFQGDPNKFVGGAGWIPDYANVTAINMAGGFATVDKTTGFSGKFVRT